MKKTIFFLLGLLVASAMPGNGLRAQSVTVNVQVKTLDRAALQSARIYSATSGTTYYVDSDHLSSAWTGVAHRIDTITSLPLAISEGFNIIGSVDSAAYALSFIVATDTNNVCYVLGAASREQRDTGIFQGSELFAGVPQHTFTDVLYANTHMLGTVRPVITDSTFYNYSTFATAVANAPASAILTFIDTVNVSSPVYFDKPLTIYQNHFPLISSHVDASTPLMTVDNGVMVKWNGNFDSVLTPALSGTLVDLVYGNFIASRTVFSAGTHVVSAHGVSYTSFDSCSFITASDVPAILLDSSSLGVVRGSTFSNKIVSFGPTSTGFFGIDEHTAAHRESVNAPAYITPYFNVSSGIRYFYFPSIQRASDYIAVDTVFLNRNVAAGVVDTISSNIQAIELNGDTILGSLVFNHSGHDITLQNGTVNFISGADNANGRLILSNLDSVGNLVPNNLEVVINDGRYQMITPATGANVTINGGKFNQTLNSYLAPRHTMVANTDADAASFSQKVVEGYKVTFVNYNARYGQPGYVDSVIVVNNPNNRIVPAPTRPTYVGADTIFSTYFVDALYTRPWNFLSDSLTSDTVLYAKWYAYNNLTDGRYTVYHRRQALDGTFGNDLCDSVLVVDTLGDNITVGPYLYIGFHTYDTTTHFTLNGDTTLEFRYYRDTMQVVYDLAGGIITDGSSDTAYFAYGAPVTYPTVARPGYTHTGWSFSPSTMIAIPFTTTAQYTRNNYLVTWSHSDTTVYYNGAARNEVYATYVDDNMNTVNGIITITDANGNTVSEARTVGTYTLHVAPVDTNYHLVGFLSTTLTIAPAPVEVIGVSVNVIKLYDGTTDVVVNAPGTPRPIYGNDDLSVSAVAFYDDPAVGDGKNITVSYTLHGADMANYTLANSSVIVTTTAAIVEPFIYDADSADNGILVNADGYCSGDLSGIVYYLESGTPDQYKLVYSAEAREQGFTNVPWTSITTLGTADLEIPADAASGDYTVSLVLRNSAYPQFESTPIDVTFHVNLSRNFIRRIFDNVIAIVDTTNEYNIDLNSIKWYHNGVYVGDGPYYQEDSAMLTGSYYVTLTIDGEEERTCEQTDLTTLATEPSVEAVNVSAYPNPAVDRVNVSIENSFNTSHNLRVMSVLGVTLVETTFNGNSTTVDFSHFGAGSYTVIVDGIAVRVLKY